MTDSTSTPALRVGLAGAGPWAERAYAPMLAAGPETRLECVWARRPEAARALAESHGTTSASSFQELLDRCDAVAFAVPPDVQAELGVLAARAGRHLMLDKPLALGVEPARRLVAAIESAGVVSQLMLTHRYRAATAAFLDRARTFETYGARFAFLSNAHIRGAYATPWRQEQGALHDLGPHGFDLIEAALGPIEELHAAGDPRRWVSLTLTHASGVVTECSMSGVVPLERTINRLELFGPAGELVFDAVEAASEPAWPEARRRFAAAVRAGRSSELDARHGLRLQELIERAIRALGS